MTGKRTFHVCVAGDKSKTKKIKNGVPQGSVLAPMLFNIYISDMPVTNSIKFGYADDLAAAIQSRTFNELEMALSQDIESLHSYFNTWYLRMNQTKTYSMVFHLDNHNANRTLQVHDSITDEILSTEL